MLHSTVTRNIFQKMDGRITVDETVFMTIVRQAIVTVDFDDEWYLEKYDDVRLAIKAGKCASARHHFLDTGYLEGRLPRLIVVDSAYYLENNPDVAEAVRQGEIKDAQTHFEESGLFEGRSPYANFSMFSDMEKWLGVTRQTKRSRMRSRIGRLGVAAIHLKSQARPPIAQMRLEE